MGIAVGIGSSFVFSQSKVPAPKAQKFLVWNDAGTDYEVFIVKDSETFIVK